MVDCHRYCAIVQSSNKFGRETKSYVKTDKTKLGTYQIHEIIFFG
jgi:hypothetical protein